MLTTYIQFDAPKHRPQSSGELLKGGDLSCRQEYEDNGQCNKEWTNLHQCIELVTITTEYFLQILKY